MRCCNCGWDNPENDRICQKCGNPLDSAEAIVEASSCLCATPELRICRNCGYPVTIFSDTCPNCNCDPDAGEKEYFLFVVGKSDERIRLENGKSIILGGIEYRFEILET